MGIRNCKGFTLIEMMIVLMIISVLLLVAIPNMTKSNDVAQSKGCEATIDMLQAQVGAYKIENNKLPNSLKELKTSNYVDHIVCPDQAELALNEGEVIISGEGE